MSRRRCEWCTWEWKMYAIGCTLLGMLASWATVYSAQHNDLAGMIVAPTCAALMFVAVGMAVSTPIATHRHCLEDYE